MQKYRKVLAVLLKGFKGGIGNLGGFQGGQLRAGRIAPLPPRPLKNQVRVAASPFYNLLDIRIMRVGSLP